MQASQAHAVRATPNSVLSAAVADPFYGVRMDEKIAAQASRRPPYF
jgi:hypothetical protein